MRKIILSLLFIGITPCSFGQADVLYSFFIAGHTYGTPGVNNEGLHPPFKDQFTYLQSRPEIELGVLTGDIVFTGTETDWDEVDTDIAALGLPVYFAAGNHDLTDRDLYESRYGSSWYHFIQHDDLFLVLDPNIDKWDITGEQFTYMNGVLASNAAAVANIYVFFHQVLWWEDDNEFASFRFNSSAGRRQSPRFWTSLMPQFTALTNRVVMMAGDCGAGWWADDYMYGSYSNVEFIASGMGEGLGDNYVIVNVMEDKSLEYELILLNDSNGTTSAREAWCSERFTESEKLDALLSGWSSDPDTDRRTNDQEFLFGGDPRMPDDSLLRLSRDGRLSFQQRHDSPEIQYALEVSTDFMHWDPVPEEAFTVLKVGAGWFHYQLNLPDAAMGYYRQRAVYE